MQRLEVSDAVRPIYGSLGCKWLIDTPSMQYFNIIVIRISHICKKSLNVPPDFAVRWKGHVVKHNYVN